MSLRWVLNSPLPLSDLAFDDDVAPRILSAIENGDPQASEQLLPLVYEELRRLTA